MFNLMATLGLDSGQFKRQMKGASDSVTRFQGLLGQIGISAAAFQVVTWFKNIVANANAAEGSLDKNILAIQRFSDQLDKIKTVAMDFGTSVLGSLNRLGEGIGNTINRMMGRTQDQIDQAREAMDSLAKAEAQLAKLQERNKKDGEEAIKIQQKNLELSDKIRKAKQSEIEQERELGQTRKRVAELQALDAGGQLTGRGQKELAELQAQILTDELKRVEAKKALAKSQEAELSALNQAFDTMRAQMAFDRLGEAEKLESLERKRVEQLRLINNLAQSYQSAEGKILIAELKVELLETEKQRLALSDKIAEKEKADAEELMSLRKRISDQIEAAQIAQLSMAGRWRATSQNILEIQEKIAKAKEDGNERAVLELTLDLNDAEQDRLDLQEKITAEMASQKKQLEEQAESMQEAIRNRSGVSLSDLASGDFGGGNKRKAEQIQKLEDRARQARSRGNVDLADKLTKEALDKRGKLEGLSDDERDPLSGLKDSMKETKEAIEKGNEELVKEIEKLRTDPV